MHFSTIVHFILSVYGLFSYYLIDLPFILSWFNIWRNWGTKDVCEAKQCEIPSRNSPTREIYWLDEFCIIYLRSLVSNSELIAGHFMTRMRRSLRLRIQEGGWWAKFCDFQCTHHRSHFIHHLQAVGQLSGVFWELNWERECFWEIRQNSLLNDTLSLIFSSGEYYLRTLIASIIWED